MLVLPLLAARTRQQRKVITMRGDTDAFGRWIDNPLGAHDVLSVLAAVVQSHELKIMLSLLPILKSEDQIYLLSWLHDGVTLQFGNHTKKQRQIRKLKEAIRLTVDTMGIATRLDVKELPTLR